MAEDAPLAARTAQGAAQDICADRADDEWPEPSTRWAELAAELEGLAFDATTDADRAALLARRARIVDDHLDDAEASVDAWERVLAVAPEHVVALRASVEASRRLHAPIALIEALERLLAHGARLLDEDELHAIVRELSALHADEASWERAAELVARDLDLTDEPEERRAILRRLATILDEQFEDPEQAFDVLLEALPEGLMDAELTREIERLARWTSRFADLVTASAAWLTDEAMCPDARAKIELLLHVARWYGELRLPAYAIDCLEQASAMAIYDVRPRLALARVYDAEGRVDDALTVLDAAFARAPGKRERREAALALAALHEKARPDASIAYAHYVRARELDGDDVRALRGIARLAPAVSAWGELGDVLDRLLELAEGDDERAAALRQAAEAREVHFLDPEGAAARLEQALEIDSHDDASYVALARCYRKLRLWDAAVHAHERHIEATSDERARVEAHGALARICEVELGVLERAIEAHRCALDLDPDHLPSLEALARLHERRGETALALSAAARVAEVTTDPRQKVDVYCRLAIAHEEKLGDRIAARAFYRAALDQDPEHVPAIAALRRIASELGEHEELSLLLEREQRQTKAPRARAKLLVELALLRRDQLDDPRAAMHAFEEAHACDPDHEGAALAIAEACVERNEMARAEPLLARLARDAGKKGRFERNRLYAMYGQALAAIGKPKRAIEIYRKALEAVSTDGESLRGLAEATWTVGDHRAAIVAHQKLLTMLADDEVALRAQTLYRLGAAHRDAGDPRKAAQMLERALELDPSNRPSLRALCDLHRSRGAHAELVSVQRRLAELEGDEGARFAMLCEIAETCANGAGDHEEAVLALEDALRVRPDDRRLLHRLMQQQEAALDWPGVCDTIERIVALDTDAARSAKYLRTAAQIHHGQMQDDLGAASCLERALDRDASQLEAFAQLESIWTSRRAWQPLEASYRRMIERIGGHADADLAFQLWHGLGCIYRDRLNDRPSSVECFRVASRLRPDDSQERQILAEVYQASDRADLAIGELHQAIARNPLDPQPYRALYALATRCGMLDRAYVVASALVFLGAADAEQRGCVEELRPPSLPTFRATITDPMFNAFVVHETSDPTTSAILALVAPAAQRAKLAALERARGARPRASLGPCEEPTSAVPAARVCFGLARVLALPAPRVHVRRDVTGTIGGVSEDPRATVIGASLLGKTSLSELAFIAGRHLAAQRPELVVRAQFPALSEVASLLAAAIAVGEASVDGIPPVIAATARVLEAELSAEDRVRLRELVAQARSTSEKLDPQRWMQAAEIAILRTAFALSGDLASATRIVRNEPVVAGDLSGPEKVKELLRWAVSPAYLDMRRALGIAVRTATTSPLVDDGTDDEPTVDRKICA